MGCGPNGSSVLKLLKCCSDPSQVPPAPTGQSGSKCPEGRAGGPRASWDLSPGVIKEGPIPLGTPPRGLRTAAVSGQLGAQAQRTEKQGKMRCPCVGVSQDQRSPECCPSAPRPHIREARDTGEKKAVPAKPSPWVALSVPLPSTPAAVGRRAQLPCLTQNQTQMQF